MCYLRVQHATLSYVHVTHGWAAFLLLSASQGRDSRKAKAAWLPTERERGAREGREMKGGRNVVKWNEVPFVADKIILLPWPASLKQFEHDECSWLCCWQTTKSLTDMQINVAPSNKRPKVFPLSCSHDFTFILYLKHWIMWLHSVSWNND